MGKTAKEAGWHISRYNLSAPLPEGDRTAMVNLYHGSCFELSPMEMYLLSVAEELDEGHPILKSFAKRGLIVNFDERSVLEASSRATCYYTTRISLTICPTLGCNFDCPYCFEHHRAGRMSKKVQDDVVALAERLLDSSGVKQFFVTWFGGEPLLQPDIIQSLSDRLMALCEERGAEYSASIITNGYLLNQEIVEILKRGRVQSAQITLDGIGEAHNATRHLAGGGPTFDRIIDNLRTLKLPFRVSIRHNIYAGNLSEFQRLDALIRSIAGESGNDIDCHPAPVRGSNPEKGWNGAERNACGSDLVRFDIERDVGHRRKINGHYCMAQSLFSITVDDQGNLYKCWEDVDDPKRGFSTAERWIPLKPFDTVVNPDQLTAYLNTALPNHSQECWECRWLPICLGGCPRTRLRDGKPECVAYKDLPEEYVLARYRDMQHKKRQAERDTTRNTPL